MVEKKEDLGRKFTEITDNKSNTISVPDYAVTKVSAQKSRSREDTGITERVEAVFLNGMLTEAEWTSQVWVRPVDNSIIPYADTIPMEIDQNWANGILATYGFPKLKGEKTTVGLGGMSYRTRKQESGKRCFSADGTQANGGTFCERDVSISFKAIYDTDIEPRIVCWYGVCRFELRYLDGAGRQYESSFYAALHKAYIAKFGSIDSTTK